MDSPLSLLAVPVLIAMNAFFVAGEYAVVAIRPGQIAAMRKSGARVAADAMERLKAQTANSIGTIQVCITMTNLLLGWLGEPAMSSLLQATVSPLIEMLPDRVERPLAVTLAFLVVTLLTVVFSELLPKAVTLRYVPAVASITAVPIQTIQWATRPLVLLMNAMANLVTRPLGLGKVEQMEEEHVSTEELRLMATEAAREGVLSPRERSLILNTLLMNRRTARHIMVPRIKVSHLDLEKTMDENRAIMNEHLYSRLPLCQGGLDNVLGVVHTKEFLSAYHAAGDTSVLTLIAREAVFAPEIATTDKLLALFREKRTEFVFLVDEFGGLAGIVTLGDVVDDLLGAVDESKELMAEGLKGDITDKRRPSRRAVRGDLSVHALAQLLDRPDWAGGEDAATVGGLIQSRLGHVASTGEQVEVDGVVLKVVRADNRAVRRVEVTLVEPRPAATPAPP